MYKPELLRLIMDYANEKYVIGVYHTKMDESPNVAAYVTTAAEAAKKSKAIFQQIADELDTFTKS